MAKQRNEFKATLESEPGKDFFLVVHPLDDHPEEKLKSDHLPPLELTPSVRWSLFTLRAYLILMIVLCCYHVVGVAAHIVNR